MTHFTTRFVVFVMRWHNLQPDGTIYIQVAHFAFYNQVAHFAFYNQAMYEARGTDSTLRGRARYISTLGWEATSKQD